MIKICLLFFISVGCSYFPIGINTTIPSALIPSILLECTYRQIEESLIVLGCPAQDVEKYAKDILSNAIEYRVPWKDLVVTMKIESNFNDFAIGDSVQGTVKRAVGIMQILPSMGLRISQMLNDSTYIDENCLKNSSLSIKYATYLLSLEKKIWKKRELYIKAYYLGSPRLSKYMKGDTLDYVRFDTENHWNRYKEALRKIDHI